MKKKLLEKILDIFVTHSLFITKVFPLTKYKIEHKEQVKSQTEIIKLLNISIGPSHPTRSDRIVKVLRQEGLNE